MKSKKDKQFTLKELKIILKAFHLDSNCGKYNKNQLNWCNIWIQKNIIEIYFKD